MEEEERGGGHGDNTCLFLASVGMMVFDGIVLSCLTADCEGQTMYVRYNMLCAVAVHLVLASTRSTLKAAEESLNFNILL
jgi:hypothetical protein